MAKDTKIRNIGVPGIEAPIEVCTDKHCPFHGSLPVRGKIMEGVVVSTKMQKTISLKSDYLKLVKKYSRFERRRRRIHAHVPDCFDIRVGDIVKVMECRPISKNVACVVIASQRPETSQEAK